MHLHYDCEISFQSVSPFRNGRIISNFFSKSPTVQRRYDELHTMVKGFFSVEEPRHTKLFPAEDVKALEILKQTTKKVNNRYVVGLLWRNQHVNLPDNYIYAFNGLCRLEKKLKNTPSLIAIFQQQIDDLVLKGYAKKLTPSDLEVEYDKTWYLPIFSDTNPNKPNEIRLVWDAVAKYSGASLNDFLIPGPDLLNPLLDILLKFRAGSM